MGIGCCWPEGCPAAVPQLPSACNFFLWLVDWVGESMPALLSIMSERFGGKGFNSACIGSAWPSSPFLPGDDVPEEEVSDEESDEESS